MVKKIVRGSIKIGGIEMNSNILLGIMIPFIGTTLGSAMVFFMKKEMNVRLQKMLLGFASGVMIAASVWSLLIPAIDMSEQAGGISWMPPAVGFLFGMGFLLVLDTLIPHLHFTEEKPEGVPSQLKKTTMLVLAVTLHNIPEGMAVGVTFAGVMTENSVISLAGALALSIGIAIQKLSGRGNYIHASAKSWIVKRKGIFIRGNVRHCRTDCGGDHHFSDRNRRASPSLSFVFCGRSHDLCRCRRTHSRISGRRTFQYRNDRSGGRLCSDDDT